VAICLDCANVYFMEFNGCKVKGLRCNDCDKKNSYPEFEHRETGGGDCVIS
jgi:hypothetical protein